MSRQITASEVAQHNTTDSLWIIIKGKVYDVTKFLDEHPGGPEVMEAEAGKDATIAFFDVGHSRDAVDMLNDYYIGDVKEESAPAPSSAKATNASNNEKKSAEGAVPMSKVIEIIVPLAVGVAVFFVYKRVMLALAA